MSVSKLKIELLLSKPSNIYGETILLLQLYQIGVYSSILKLNHDMITIALTKDLPMMNDERRVKNWTINMHMKNPLQIIYYIDKKGWRYSRAIYQSSYKIGIPQGTGLKYLLQLTL